MKTECYYKKGAPVIYHYQEWRRVYWGESGYGWVGKWKRATLVAPPRDEYGRFTNHEPDIYSVTLKDEQGNIFEANIDRVEPDRKITDLTREEIVKLYSQVCRYSHYYSDYKNTLGVFQNVVSEYFEGFWQYLVGEFGEERAEKEDTAEAFAEYIMYYCAA